MSPSVVYFTALVSRCSFWFIILSLGRMPNTISVRSFSVILLSDIQAERMSFTISTLLSISSLYMDCLLYTSASVPVAERLQRVLQPDCVYTRSCPLPATYVATAAESSLSLIHIYRHGSVMVMSKCTVRPCRYRHNILWQEQANHSSHPCPSVLPIVWYHRTFADRLQTVSYTHLTSIYDRKWCMKFYNSYAIFY